MKITPYYIIIGAIGMTCLFGSCNSNQSSGSATTESDDSDALPYGVADTVYGRKVGADCAVSVSELQRIRYRAEHIASPSMLMTFRAEYEDEIAKAKKDINDISDEERKMLSNEEDTIRMILAEKRKTMEVPAEGVIDNLKNCINKVKQMKTDSQMLMFLDARRGLMSDLDIIHLCVEEHSSRIPEVKRLAKELKKLVEEKKKQFRIDK